MLFESFEAPVEFLAEGEFVLARVATGTGAVRGNVRSRQFPSDVPFLGPALVVNAERVLG